VEPQRLNGHTIPLTVLEEQVSFIGTGLKFSVQGQPAISFVNHDMNKFDVSWPSSQIASG
jgi:hypothetical protein